MVQFEPKFYGNCQLPGDRSIPAPGSRGGQAPTVELSKSGWELLPAIGVKDMTFLKSLWADECGASAAEYALILAIVGTGIAVAAYNLGTAIKGSMDNAVKCIKNTNGNGTC